MKKIFQRIIRGLTAALMALSMTPSLGVKAEQITGVPSGYQYRLLNHQSSVVRNLTLKQLGNTTAYCIQPKTDVSFNDVYETEALAHWDGASAQQKETIAMISAFGYGYGSRTDIVYYAAAQSLIWNVLGEPVSWENASTVKTAGNEIMKTVSAYSSNPDPEIIDTVTNEQVGADSADAVLGRTYRIHDKAGAMASMGSLSYENLTVPQGTQNSLKNNYLDVRIDQANTEGRATVHSADSYESAGQPFVLVGYDGGNPAQNLIVRGSTPKKSFSFSLRGTYTEAEFLKTDENGKALSGAEMVLKDMQGNVKESWTSSQEGHHAVLPAGISYQVQETDAPDGYYCLDFTVDIQGSAEGEKEELRNSEKIHYEVMKQDEKGNPVKGAKLMLYDVTDGEAKKVEINDRKGNPWITDGKPRDISAWLHCGHSYSVVESDVSTKYFLAENIRFSVAMQAPEKNEMITETLVDNHISYHFAKVDEKGNPVEDAELTIYDVNDNNRKVYSFTTGAKPTETGLLERGGTYRLVETKTPDGRYTMEEKTFTVPEYHDASPITVTGVDAEIVYEAEKTDENGIPVSGASMELYDITDGKEILIQSFISAEKPVRLNGMMVMHTYRLKETGTPLGYHTAEAKEFTVPSRGNSEPVMITAVDHTIAWNIRKTDIDGNRIADITLTVRDAESNVLIGTWQTKPDTDISIGTLVKEGDTYILEETETVNGYYFSRKKKFTIPASYSENNTVSITMVDEAIHYSILKIDEDGNAAAGAQLELRKESSEEVLDSWISDGTGHTAGHLLHAGETYILHEAAAPNGYFYAKDVTFQVPEYLSEGTKNIEVKMVDDGIHYEIAKHDEEGKSVEGVHLKLTDIEDGSLIGEWDTDKNRIRLDHILKAGHTYLLEETEWINGVQKAADVSFTVPEYGSAAVFTISMIDETNAVNFLKTDPQGNPIAGAVLQILDMDGTLIAEMISTEDQRGIAADSSGRNLAELLKGGSSYILHEAEAPFGYQTAADIIFTMTGTISRPQIIQMTDVPKTVYLKVRKVSLQDDTPLGDCQMTVYHAETDQQAADIHGQKAAVTTAEDGDGMLALPYSPQGYYLKETKAPAGYVIDENQHTVETDHERVFEEKTAASITVKDEKEVNTGIRNMFPMLGMMFAFIVSAGIFAMAKSVNR
jgi:hypothetical protein